MCLCFDWRGAHIYDILVCLFAPLARYALFFASRGANVVVNDLGPSTTDKNRKAADVVVEEIKKAGKGDAIANYNSNLDGAKIVQQAIDKWGRVDVSGLAPRRGHQAFFRACQVAAKGAALGPNSGKKGPDRH